MLDFKNKSVPEKERAKKIENADNFTVKWSTNKIVLQTFILITCIKVLLIPTYHSTDFEVHRNWLATTHSLPLKEWYFNEHSQWTLDYPPFFAWFEYVLSQIATFFDSEMLKVTNLNYASSMTVVFQRTTVMFSDLMFAYGTKEISELFCTSHNSKIFFILLSLCNVGLLIVDHIHFQYNGFLLGILLLSLAKVSKTDSQVSVLQGAMWFCILLNLKHIYLYVAPAYVVWLLRSYCLKDGHFVKRILILGCIVLSSLILSFGPFVTQLPQVISRLFPFKRGLVHAYWAANEWSLYIVGDKILSIIWKHIGWMKETKSAIMTGGLVQEQSFIILPTPTPVATFLLTFMSLLPLLWSSFRDKEFAVNPKQFVRCIILCGLNSFMLGWHVHEKAILTAVIPLCALAVTNINDARIFMILSAAGHTALLPLLYPNNLIPLKLLLLLLYMFLTVCLLSRQFEQPLLRLHEWLYVSVLPLLTVYETILHNFFFRGKLPFLPLALTSVYCAVGITYAWLFYYYIFLSSRDIETSEKKKEYKKEANSAWYQKQKIL